MSEHVVCSPGFSGEQIVPAGQLSSRIVTIEKWNMKKIFPIERTISDIFITSRQDAMLWSYRWGIDDNVADMITAVE